MAGVESEKNDGSASLRPEEWLTLQSGPLSMRFEPKTAFLRHIRLGDREVLRGAYAAVRDQYWATIDPVVRIQTLDQQSDSFLILYESDVTHGNISFQWTGTIRGSSDGVIRFGFDGRARSAFLRNRIGFCILHPAAECAGRPCRIEHVDGSIESGTFPRQISPDQPFYNIRAITHEVADGVSAEVRMQGDAFEMEDQRNWTDASFKTYSTPLALPHPVAVAAGTSVRQALSLTLHRATAGAITRVLSARSLGPLREAAPVEFRLPDTGVSIRVPSDMRSAVPVPRVGFVAPGETDAITSDDVGLARAVRPDHARVTIDLQEGDWRATLRRASESLATLGCPMHLVATVGTSDTGDEQLQELHAALKEEQTHPTRLFVFEHGSDVTPAERVHGARSVMHDVGERIPVGGGTNRYFTQLNRDRPPPDAFDVICYSMNPQVHVFDNLSMVETLPVQGETVRNARTFLPDTEVAPGPITLRPRLVRGEGGKYFDAPPDPRQKTPFAACWTLGSIKYLAASKADSLTYYEFTGPGGIMPGGSASVYPLYHVFSDIAEFSTADLLGLESSQPLRVDGLVLTSGERFRILLANMSPEPQSARLRLSRPINSSSVHIRTLDEMTLNAATRTPLRWREEGLQPYRGPAGETPPDRVRELFLSLAPYAYVCIDGQVDLAT